MQHLAPESIIVQAPQPFAWPAELKIPGPFETVGRLILASNSPRRHIFLKDLGLSFLVRPAELEESPGPAESPYDYVIRLAHEKAQTIANSDPDAWVLGADTTVVLAGTIMGKPRDSEDAERMLRTLAGKVHEVITGYCVCRARDSILAQRAVKSMVEFAGLSDEAIRAYVMTGESLDKAGGYAIQGHGGFLVARIQGSYSNVVGLPLAEMVADLVKLGAIRPRLRL